MKFFCNFISDPFYLGLLGDPAATHPREGDEEKGKAKSRIHAIKEPCTSISKGLTKNVQVFQI